MRVIIPSHTQISPLFLSVGFSLCMASKVVAALDLIIEKYQDHIAPHAAALTQQLTRCFLEYASVRATLTTYAVYILLGFFHRGMTHSGSRSLLF